MVEKIFKKTLRNINPLSLSDLRDIQHDIQRGNDMLLEDFGSQEAVDAHLQEVKEELYQKLFSTPVTCSKRNCSYLS